MKRIKKAKISFYLGLSILALTLTSASCSKGALSEDSDELIPTIILVEPLFGLEQSTVTITGKHFSQNSGDVRVHFGDMEADQITFSSKEQIAVLVPVGAATSSVSVTIVNRAVVGPVFTVLEQSHATTPVNFKVAFLGDSEIGASAQAVLQLVKEEGAMAVVHPGDLDYGDNPQGFEDHINSILGTDFPYFFSVGNHDDEVWVGAGGYQSFLEARFDRLGIAWNGQLGVMATFSYQGIFFVVSAPDEFDITPADAGNHVRQSLAEDHSIWRVSLWHKNQRLMQIGGKSDEAGWEVYEESRKGGAIMATGHEHSYSRTYEMSNFENQTISSTESILNLTRDNIATADTDEGRSFAFVSGLGGRGIRDAESELDKNPWWANVYHSENGGQYGALFGEFNFNGDPTLARFYFKDIDGVIRDTFFVRSNN